MQLQTGLVSITFRGLSPERIVGLTASAGLWGIEWGGDLHVPHGRVDVAREVQRMTLDAGLSVAAYGSYYRFGDVTGGDPTPGASETLDTAEALGAPLLRVWAGTLASALCDETTRWRIVEGARRLAADAAKRGIGVAFEYHGGTLTDTLDSTIRLLKEVDHPNLRTLWQPAVDRGFADRARELQAVLPYLANIHTFHWVGSGDDRRRALAEGETDWTRYLSIASAGGAEGYPHAALIEFVRGDDPDQFLSDAATLKRWVARLPDAPTSPN